MPEIVKIKKGLDLCLDGEAPLELATPPQIRDYAVKPTDFIDVAPKLLVEEGDSVLAGNPLFYDKRLPSAMFTSPVSGSVKAIVRGEKRKILSVIVASDGKNAFLPFKKLSHEYSREELIGVMTLSGVWNALRQRPFGLVANPEDTPKSIFVSVCESVPLAPNADFALSGREDDFFEGLKALARLTAGTVHLCGRPNQPILGKAKLQSIERLAVHEISGPHPAGNIGTQIAFIDPINKGETIWTMQLQDVAVLGHLIKTGEYRPLKRIALAGPEVRLPRYYDIMAGACLSTILESQLKKKEHVRVVSGDVLTGTRVAIDGFLGARDTLVTVIPEGDYYDFMGWLLPGFRKFSFSRTFISGFMRPRPFFKMDSGMHGSVRPLVVTGQYEKVFPLNIYPLQLIKACIVRDIALMENLGIYEVEPEDFALCEFIDTSKTEIQTIVREALEYIRKN